MTDTSVYNVVLEARMLHVKASQVLVSVHETMMLVERYQKSSFAEIPSVDVGFYLRESSKMLDEARKEIDARLKLVSEQLSLSIIKAAQAGGGELTVHGTVASATADVGMEVNPPPRDSPEHARLLEELGIEDPNQATRLHWPSLCEAVTRREKNGLNTSVRKRTVFKCTYRKLRSKDREDDTDQEG